MDYWLYVRVAAVHLGQSLLHSLFVVRLVIAMLRREGSGVAGGLNNVKQTSGPSACGDLFSGLSMYSRVQQIRLTSVLAALQMVRNLCSYACRVGRSM